MTVNGVNGWQATEAGQALQAQLSDERTLRSLTRLLERVDSLEKTLGTVSEAPGMIAMVGDIADETVSNAAARGVDLEERFRTGLALLERLSEPKTAAKLDALIDLADQVPHLTAMVGDIVDETVSNAAANGVNIEERVRAGVTMAEKLTAPDTMEKVDQLMVLADQAPGLVAMVGDIADETIGKAAANGIDIEARLKTGLTLAERLTAPEMENALGTLLDPQVTALLGKTGEAINIGLSEPPQKVGAFALLRQLNDPDLQRAVGFLTTVGKALGKQLG